MIPGSKILNIAIILLVIVAIGLGYFLIQSKLPSYLQLPKQSNSNNQIKQNTSSSSANVSEPLRQLLGVDFPNENATDAQRRAFSDAVNRVAAKSDTLQINNCVPNPSVIQLNNNQSFTIKNTGNDNITVNLGTIKLDVPSNSNKVFKADFGHGPGMYGYSCNQSAQTLGLFSVIPALTPTVSP